MGFFPPTLLQHDSFGCQNGFSALMDLPFNHCYKNLHASQCGRKRRKRNRDCQRALKRLQVPASNVWCSSTLTHALTHTYGRKIFVTVNLKYPWNTLNEMFTKLSFENAIILQQLHFCNDFSFCFYVALSSWQQARSCDPKFPHP